MTDSDKREEQSLVPRDDNAPIGPSEGETPTTESPAGGGFGRRELKSYFYTGALPQARHFHALIDGTVNRKDDGFSRTAEDGIRIHPEPSHDRVLSFFRSFGSEALWRVELGPDDELIFKSAAGEGITQGEHGVGPSLTLAPDGRIGIGRVAPETELDVSGFVRSSGRRGIHLASDDDEALPTPIADGKWHALTGTLYGLQALEVTVGVAGKRRGGEYAILHALALNAFNARGWYFNPFGFNFLRRKNRIHVHQAYYRSRRDKLELRWFGDESGYCLKVRSRRPYGGGEAVIRYHITDLWPWPLPDPSTAGSPAEPSEPTIAGSTPPDQLPAE